MKDLQKINNRSRLDFSGVNVRLAIVVRDACNKVSKQQCKDYIAIPKIINKYLECIRASKERKENQYHHHYDEPLTS